MRCWGNSLMFSYLKRQPAQDTSAQKAYIDKVKQCDVYIGIFGTKYGAINENGISPTEEEYDVATALSKYRLAFILRNNNRDEQEHLFIEKVSKDVVRKSFSNYDELRTAIYAALIHYLVIKEIIRVTPFDATWNHNATMDDISDEKLRVFVENAKAKRSFPLTMEAGKIAILKSLNLLSDNGELSNSALLLFGNNPQKFFCTSEVKCVQFYGDEVQKPAPYYQVFRGTVFELVDQAKAFVMSHINAKIGDHSTDDNVEYELPESAVHEAIVNAVVHRDYTSTASVQVMLFKNRLEIHNPGQLPYGITVEALKKIHSSIPANPILAHPMYLAAYIEELGTGTTDMVKKCVKKGLKSPEFIQDADFTTIIWRQQEVVEQVTQQVTQQVNKLVLCLGTDICSMKDIMQRLNLKDRTNVLYKYLMPAIEAGYVCPTQPNSANSPTQTYRLTSKGIELYNKNT